jgi:hypothetical protein
MHTEPVLVNLLRSPGIDSQPGGPVRQHYLSYGLTRLHRLAESIPGLFKRLQIRAPAYIQQKLCTVLLVTLRRSICAYKKLFAFYSLWGNIFFAYFSATKTMFCVFLSVFPSQNTKE